jgi:hypothetical protein
MMIVWLVGGCVTCMLINYLFIRPIERKKWRRMCEEEGLVPKGFWKGVKKNDEGRST